MITLSILYVYYNTPKEIEASVLSVLKAAKDISYEIIVIDNLSPRPLPLSVRKRKNVCFVVNTVNKGYGGGLNQAASLAKGQYLLLSNPDTIYSPSSLRLMIRELHSDKHIGLLGPKMVSRKQKTLPTISKTPFLPEALVVYSIINKLFPKNPVSKKFWMLESDREKIQEVEVISGACMMVRRQVFEQIKGFDERFFMYFEESDICFRVRKAGYTVIYYPKAVIMHHVGRSSRDKVFIQRAFEKSRYAFFKKYHGFLRATFAEGLLRLATIKGLLLFFILLTSLYIVFRVISLGRVA